MNIIKNSKSVPLLAALAFTVFIYSCKKDVTPTGGTNAAYVQAHQDEIVKKAQDIASKIKQIKIVKEYPGMGNRIIGGFSMRDGGFTFADGNEGFNFSSSSGVEFVPDASGGGTLFISAGGFGGNSAGGTVQAGNSQLEINYTFCMSADDSSLNLNFFGPSFTGVSMVLGISGDFDAILSGSADTTSDLGDIFHGMAMYVIYADEASGTYNVVNWMEDLNDATNDPDGFANKGFAWVADFRNWSMYFSSEGQLNVSGGSIGFSGKYLALIPEEGSDPFDLTGDIEVKEVDGLGVMGCN